MPELPEAQIIDDLEHDWRAQTIARSNLMANLDEGDREERIVRAGDAVIDLRETFRREQEKRC